MSTQDDTDDEECLFPGEPVSKKQKINTGRKILKLKLNPSLDSIRDAVLQIGCHVNLMYTLMQMSEYRICQGHQGLQDALQACTKNLIFICGCLNKDFVDLINDKMEVNRLKYPLKVCDNLSIRDSVDKQAFTLPPKNVCYAPDPNAPFEVTAYFDMQKKFRARYHEVLAATHLFALKRNWLYTPKEVLLAIMTEYGELCEAVNWDCSKTRVRDLGLARQHCILMEVADVAIFCLHLARLYRLYMPIIRADPDDVDFSKHSEALKTKVADTDDDRSTASDSTVKTRLAKLPESLPQHADNGNQY